jgi:hypothetical protein
MRLATASQSPAPHIVFGSMAAILSV